MAKTYTVTAPLVQAKLAAGGYVHLYKGALLPSDVDKDALESMLDGQLVTEAGAVDDSPAEMTAGSDPGEFTAAEVLAFLATTDEDERVRVLEAEQAGKARKGVLAFEVPAS